MDKRWRNLIIIIVIVIVIAAIFLILPPSSNSQKFASLLADNDYSKEDFSYSISSLSSYFPDDLRDGLVSFSNTLSGDEKKYVDDLLEIDSSKKIIFEQTVDLVDLDYLDYCNLSGEEYDSLIDLVYSVDYDINSISQREQYFGVKIDYSNVERQRQAFMDILIEKDYVCAGFLEDEQSIEINEELDSLVGVVE